jgi:hypothetical protein
MAVFSKAFFWFFLLNSSPELFWSLEEKKGQNKQVNKNKQTTGLNHFSFSRFIPSLLSFS